MQRLIYVLYQMDEARRQIDGGRLEQLRLALLLLDNAAELQLERRVNQERSSEDLKERIRERYLAITAVDQSEATKELREADILKWTPLSAAEKRKIDRYFDQKLEYLSTRHEILDPRLARVLSYIHRYRNEAYHEGRVRRETARAAALILFEANCQLLISVYRIAMWSSNDDYSWVTERFGVTRPFAWVGDDMEAVVGRLRDEVVPTLGVVVAVLTDHVRSRIEDMWEALDFLVANTRIEDRKMALWVAQQDARLGRGKDATLGDWTPERVQDLYESVDDIATATDRLEAFAKFSALEETLESIEVDVGSLASEVDQAIQYEIDRRRGK